MKFHITKHAREKLEERNIPDPSKVILRKLGPRLRKLVRASCQQHGYQVMKTIYFVSTVTGYDCVYVCAQKGINRCYLITAFKYLLPKSNQNRMKLETLSPDYFEKLGFTIYGSNTLGEDKTAHRAELERNNYKIIVDTYRDVYLINSEGVKIKVDCVESMHLDNLIKFIDADQEKDW